MIPMCRPLLPGADRLLSYLRNIDDSRWYSNAGPFVKEYEARLGKLFNCHVAATSSGTTGLTAALIAQDIVGHIIMPAWTFVATANAVRAAGCEVEFTDVDEALWTASDTDIAVSPFGAPVRYEDEVMTDAAASFDAYATGRSKAGKAPVVISTHATKCFSTGEGGLVLSTDEELIQNVRAIINHGLDPSRKIPRMGLNGKMSEYHAAIGLAELDGWTEKRAKWLDVKRRYIERFGVLAHTTPLSSLSWVGPTFAIRLPHADKVRKVLEEKGIASRKVWGDGVHKYDVYKFCRAEDLSVTDKLAHEVLFLPYSIDTSDDELNLMYETILYTPR